MRTLRPAARRRRLLDGVRRRPHVALALLAALGGKLVLCRLAEVDCAEAIAHGDEAMVVAVCHQSYARSKDPREGIALANALRRTGDEREATAVARSLLATSAQAGALYILGKIAARADRHDEAEAALRQALELHRQQGSLNDVAKDLHALADSANARKRFGDALNLIDDCITAARRASAPITEGYCYLASGKVLGRLGHHGAALHEIERAANLLNGPRDQAWIYLAKGDELQEAEEHAQAIVAFEQAMAMAERASLMVAARSARLNLAYSLAHTERWSEAEEHLRLTAVPEDQEDELASDRSLIAAMIELGRGDRARRAGDLAERAVQLAEQEERAALRERRANAVGPRAEMPVSDEIVEAETLRAEISYRRGEWSEAERWARRAVVHVEQLRSDQPLLQLRSWALFRHRAAQEILFASLARANRADAALEAFDAWMARATFDALTIEGGGGRDGAGVAALDAGTARAARREAVAQAAELERMLPLLRTTQLMHHERPRRDLASSSLLALVVARGEIWRLVREGGITTIDDLGELAAQQLSLDQLRTSPSHRPLAEALGARLLPAAQAVATSHPLHIVLDEPLAYLPVAALRHGGRRLGELRPLVRASRPAHLTCIKRRRATNVRFPDVTGSRLTVLADADGSLPGARREALSLARLAPQATLRLGAEANRAALLAAGNSDLLHLAVHSEVDELGGQLRLADGPLSALELAGSGHAPPRVVLATCASAVSLPGTYSLAMAFLAAGAEQTIATVRPIPDEEAARISDALYRTGTDDLVTALWLAQRGPGAPDLSSFAVFGDAFCDSP